MPFNKYNFQVKPPVYRTPKFNDDEVIKAPLPTLDPQAQAEMVQMEMNRGGLPPMNLPPIQPPVYQPTPEDAQRTFAPNSLPPLTIPPASARGFAAMNLPPVERPPVISNPFAATNVVNTPADVNQRAFRDLPPIQVPVVPPTVETPTPNNPFANLPPIQAPTPLERTEQEIYERQNKDWKIKQKDGGAGDNDHNWWDVVKNAGLGLLQGGLPGAVVGGIRGAADANADEKFLNEQKLTGLQNRYAVQSKIADDNLNRDYKRTQIGNINADNETAATNAETRKQIAQRNVLLRQLSLTKRYKRGENPAFDARLESAGIEQPDFEPGKKLKPRYWDNKTGKLMTFDDNNATVAVTTPDGKEIVNDSRREVESGGYSVMPNVARSADATVEASRVGAVNKTGDNQNDYDTKVAGLKGKIAAANTRAKRAKATIAALQNPQTQEDYNKKTNAEKDLSAAESDAAGYQTELTNLPKPVQVQSVTGNNVGTYNEAQFRKNFEGKKTPQEIETLVQAAKAQGIIK